MTDLNESFNIENWKDCDKVQRWTNDSSIIAVDVEPWAAGGGLSGDSFSVTIHRRASESSDAVATRYFAKVTKESGLAMSLQVGLAREGVFYTWAHTVPEIARVIPKALFSHGDLTVGRKVTVIELIDGDQAGFFFGKNSLHNWGKDLDSIVSKYNGLTERDVCLKCVKATASLQAPFWGKLDRLLTDDRFSTLRYRDWVRGDKAAGWEGVASWARNGWAKAKTALADKGVTMPEQLAAVMDATISKSTWSAFQDFARTHPLTLVQGDCHPSNMIVRLPDEQGDSSVVLVDWEVVGIGSGPQDIGQFMISHSHPDARRKIEREVVQAYVDELKLHGVEITFEYAWEEYCFGSVGRWVWLLGIMIGQAMPAAADQYFINQVAAFVQDHGITAENAPLLRV